MSESDKAQALARGFFHALPEEDDYEFHDEKYMTGTCDGCVPAVIVPADTLSAVTAERDGEAESCEQWRALALQFDRHRMSALAHLKMVVAGQEGALDACRDFLAAPPVPGHEITAEIDQLRAEVEALRKDAERYRWLRLSALDAGLWNDESLDAAMAAKDGQP